MTYKIVLQVMLVISILFSLYMTYNIIETSRLNNALRSKKKRMRVKPRYISKPAYLGSLAYIPTVIVFLLLLNVNGNLLNTNEETFQDTSALEHRVLVIDDSVEKSSESVESSIEEDYGSSDIVDNLAGYTYKVFSVTSVLDATIDDSELNLIELIVVEEEYESNNINEQYYSVQTVIKHFDKDNNLICLYRIDGFYVSSYQEGNLLYIKTEISVEDDLNHTPVPVKAEKYGDRIIELINE